MMWHLSWASWVFRVVTLILKALWLVVYVESSRASKRKVWKAVSVYASIGHAIVKATINCSWPCCTARCKRRASGIILVYTRSWVKDDWGRCTWESEFQGIWVLVQWDYSDKVNWQANEWLWAIFIVVVSVYCCTTSGTHACDGLTRVILLCGRAVCRIHLGYC